MSEHTNPSDASPTDEADASMLVAYRHDVHKMTGEPHDAAPDTFHGIPVNQPVPAGADGDAAALSRPDGHPEQTVDTHATHYRLSLLTGESRYDPDTFSRQDHSESISDLLTGSTSTAVHRTWLTSDVASSFNESVYYPFTSLKYHTLLVAALLDNYRDGNDFQELALVVDPTGEIVPHRTIYAGDDVALRITATEAVEGRPSAMLGRRPRRSWAATWNRLPSHPLDVEDDRWAQTLDANLRRLRSWSTALQYIEDFQSWGGRP
jgi:hypothetical protein